MRGREVGLLGAMPVDVIETSARIDQKTHRQKGIAGSAIIRDRTALIVDLFELVDTAWPEWAAQQVAEAAAPAERPKLRRAAGGGLRLLPRPGSPLSARKTAIPCLPLPTERPPGRRCWKILKRCALVVTDIEMPRMNGLDLARRIRGDERTAMLPIIALSSLAGDEDVARGKAAGIDDYLVKLDRDSLLERVRESVMNGSENWLGIGRDAATAAVREQIYLDSLDRTDCQYRPRRKEMEMINLANMKIGKRLGVGFGIVGALTLGIALLAWWGTQHRRPRGE